MSEIQMIVMPKWGLAMQEGMVAEWHVETGAEVSAGQEIMDIETSKIANVYESPVSGPLRKIVVQAGETVPVGALLGVCAPASVGDDEVEAFVTDFLDNFDFEAAAGSGLPEPESIEAGGKRINYLKMGDAEGLPVIFVHGFGGDFNNWMFNQEAISESHTTYALDLPGHGSSTKDVGGASLEHLATTVIDFMTALDIGKAHLVGHSMGGGIGLLLALNHSDRVASATLMAPAGLGPEINMDYINGFIEQKRAKKLRGILELLVADPGAITTEMVEEVIKYKRVDGVQPALEALRDSLFPGGHQAGSLRDQLANLAVPVQIVWGKQDQILPAAHGEGLPGNLKVTLYDKAGHMPHMEQAAEVNRLILDTAAAA